MTRMVVDASVIVKWVLPHRHDEADTVQALALLGEFKAGRLSLCQPPHWLAEVAAVLARLHPSSIRDDLADLYALDIPVAHDPEMYWTACELAHALDHHVFDTLYHAVALTLPDTVLVTADARYEKKARRRGAIMLLRDAAPA